MVGGTCVGKMASSEGKNWDVACGSKTFNGIPRQTRDEDGGDDIYDGMIEN